MSQTVSHHLSQPKTREPEERSVDAAELLALLGDEYTRAVLEALADAPRSGREIIEETGFSKATVYRRLDQLDDAGLVTSRTELDPDGHHRERFEPTFDGATCRFGPEGIETTLHSE